MGIKLPLGFDLFDKVRESNCYYIDKTGFISELLEENFKVNLITRPRRFGKTLTMSMLASFFDIMRDSRAYFEGLEISQNPDLCEEWMNKWPVLFLTLKDVNGDSFEDAYEMLCFSIASLCGEHEYLAYSEKVRDSDKKIFTRLMYQEGNTTDVKSALAVLIRMMESHFGRSVILLIDEYDVPLAKASDNNYYPQMLNTIQSFLGMVWKTNPALKFAVVTGRLHIAKESIFTGANNFISRSLSSKWYNRYFGFTEDEVRRLLQEAGLSGYLDEMKKWYNGYLFGGQEVYCPWDVINHVSLLQKNAEAKPANYWKDTSHNQIIRRFIDRKNLQVQDKFETLLSGGVIQEHILEDLTYDFDNSTEENLWSILYLTGYLTEAAPENFPKELCPEEGKTALRIPNEEVRNLFAETVAKWFSDGISGRDRTRMFQAWWNGDDHLLTQEVTDILFTTISYFDYKEDYYHAFVTGLFSGAGYEVVSNSEQGTGRADIFVKDRRNRRALIIEVKPSKGEHSMETDCTEALEQIKRRQYAREALKGYEKVLCYGAAFFEKQCLIKSQ